MFPGGDLTLDLRRGLPFESNCCEEIFSEHCPGIPIARLVWNISIITFGKVVNTVSPTMKRRPKNSYKTSDFKRSNVFPSMGESIRSTARLEAFSSPHANPPHRVYSLGVSRSKLWQ